MQSPISVALDAKFLHPRGATMTVQVGPDTRSGYGRFVLRGAALRILDSDYSAGLNLLIGSR